MSLLEPIVRLIVGGPGRGKIMHGPHCCPSCNDLRVNTILHEYVVIATVKGEDPTVSALAAFACEHGPIFFLRPSDLVTDQPTSGVFAATAE
jgi:hypothetical protein